MSLKNLKNLSFIALFLMLIVPASGAVDDVDDGCARAGAGGPPATPNRPITSVPLPLPELDTHIDGLSNLLKLCDGQIKNVELHFSGTKQKIRIFKIRKALDALLPLFLLYFPSGDIRFTPAVVKAFGTHLSDIAGDTSDEFLAKRDGHFLASVGSDDFLHIKTNLGNVFFIPEIVIDGRFACWKKDDTRKYNVKKLIRGNNPESPSGTIEYHHIYQQSTPVAPLVHSEHKGKSSEYHKSNESTKIDRESCGTEFKCINKMLSFIQIGHMCATLLQKVDKTKLEAETASLINEVLLYKGNTTVAPIAVATPAKDILSLLSADTPFSPTAMSHRKRIVDHPLVLNSLPKSGKENSVRGKRLRPVILDDSDDDEKDALAPGRYPLSPIRNSSSIASLA